MNVSFKVKGRDVVVDIQQSVSIVSIIVMHTSVCFKGILLKKVKCSYLNSVFHKNIPIQFFSLLVSVHFLQCNCGEFD